MMFSTKFMVLLEWSRKMPLEVHRVHEPPKVELGIADVIITYIYIQNLSEPHTLEPRNMYVTMHCNGTIIFEIDMMKKSYLKALVVKNSVLHNFGFGKVSPAKQL